MRTYADLGAERPFAAEKAGRKISVEIKSFTGRSPICDLEQALGQFALYRALLAEVEPERQIYLAVSTPIFSSLFNTLAGQVIMRELKLSLCVVNLATQEVDQWIH